MSTTASSILQTLLSQFSQRTRLLRLSTPLGAEALLVECVRGEEGLDQNFEFVISALSTDANLKLKTLIGQPALLQLMTAQSRDELRPFHGYITAVEHSGANGGFARYRLTISPWTAFATLGRDSRVFQDMTVFDIIDAVFGEYEGKGCLVPEWRFDLSDRSVYPTRSLTTQYQESNFAFVERLLAEEGLFYFFEHSGDPDSASLGKHTMVIADHNGAFKPNGQSHVRFTQSSAVMKEDGLDRWRTSVRQQTNALEMSSWDYRSLNGRPVSADHGAGSVQLSDRGAFGPYYYETSEQGLRIAERRMQGLTARSEMHVAAGTVRTLSPGTTFTLHGHANFDLVDSDEARTFLVVRTVHLMHNNLSAELKANVRERLTPSALAQLIEEEGATSLHSVGSGHGERPLYRNRIDAIRSSTPYRNCVYDGDGGERFARPTIRGQQTAVVVGPAGSVIHTDRDHRVKVQFHWQRGVQSHSRLDHPSGENHTGAPADDTAGTWIRVATPLAPVAGGNWGSNALPRVGQEVLVDFLEGDIDRPVIIGAVYNGSGGTDAQHNTVGQGSGAATGNAPAWFPGEAGAHAHPAVLSGIKTQAMSASQAGAGAYNQLVMDDTPGQARLVLQRHAAAHVGTDELNLGSLRHQPDNQRLAPAGFGAELKTEAGVAMRAGQGLLISSDARSNASGRQLDVSEAISQMQNSRELQETLATTAQKHNAKLNKEASPRELPAIVHMTDSLAVVESTTQGTDSSESGGSGEVPAFSQPHMQLSAPAGIAAVTPANAVISAGKSSSIAAGQDINLLMQANSAHTVRKGISLFTYGKATGTSKPNQETGLKLHAASGKLSSQSQTGATRITADQGISVASVTKSVTIGAPTKHVLLTAQGAYIKLEGGNIMLHGPGKMEFKASKKELTGPKSATSEASLPAPGEPKICEMRAAGAAAAGDSVVPLN